MGARLHRLVAAFRRWGHSNRAERELHDEIEAYAEMLADERRDAGLAPAEAKRQARADVGGVEAVKESVRQARAGALVEQTWQDVRYAVRGLRRTPGFTAAAVLTIALGVGVNAAVFSVVDTALLRPLPYRDVDGLVDLGHRMRAGTADEVTELGLQADEIEFWRGQSAIFAGIESYYSRPEDIEDRDSGTTIRVAGFTSGLPVLLGLSPEIGRMFTAEEAATGQPVALLSDSYWRRRFGGAPDVLGSTIRLDNEVVTIIGVLPPTLRYGPGTGGRTDVWRPMERGKFGSTIFRLAAGLSVTSAMPALQVASSQLQAARHERRPWIPELVPFDQRRSIVRMLASPLSVLLAMSGMVLLIVFANLGNLLRARFLGRSDELAMRAALGAGRARIARLLGVETSVVIALGAGVGALVAGGLIHVVPTLVPPRLGYSLFVIGLPAFDGRVLVFGLLSLTVVSVLTLSLPVLRGMRRPALTALSVAGRNGSSREGRRAMMALQAGQMGLALLLVTTSTLVASSFVRLKSADLGFQADGLSSLTVTLPAPRYTDGAAQQDWLARVLARVRQLPDVESAAVGDPPPAKATSRLSRPDDPTNTYLSAASRTAGEGYFRTVGVPLVEGREFDTSDRAGAELVLILSASAARALWPAESAVGQHVRFSFSPKIPPARVVGVVGDVAAYDFKAGKPLYAIYQPLSQQSVRQTTFMLRARAGSSVVREVTDVVRAEDPDVKVTFAGPVTMYYDEMETYAGPRVFVVLIVVFAVLALVTASVGLYGLLAYAVGQRQREIGVRVALGSTVARIRALVLTDALRPVVAGLALGWIASWLLTGYLGSLLYGISARDPVAFLASGGILLVAALFATLPPIRKATGVDPIRALRAE